MLGKLALNGDAEAADRHLQGHVQNHAPSGHAAMIGAEVPAVGGPDALDALTLPPPALPYEPGRVREYTLRAIDKEIEIAPGVFFPAWTYNGTVPGPVIRATEGDILRVRFVNAGSHPHTIHFHGIHPANMDGVFEIVQPGGVQLRVRGEARRDAALPLPCHPVEEAHSQGALRRLHHRPEGASPAGAGAGDGDERFDTDGDGSNNFYTVNGLSFYYAKHPITVTRSETVRIYLANLTEFDLINSLHLTETSSATSRPAPATTGSTPTSSSSPRGSAA